MLTIISGDTLPTLCNTLIQGAKKKRHLETRTTSTSPHFRCQKNVKLIIYYSFMTSKLRTCAYWSCNQVMLFLYLEWNSTQ